MSLQFGVSLPQGWTTDPASIKDPIEAYEAMTRVAQTADEVGFASVWLVDHVHTVPQPTQQHLFECWTTTAALARDTKRVRVGQMVTCNTYRHPALLAKMASTVDALSHGRLNFGIGAGGGNGNEWRAYGYDTPDVPERLRRLGEAVQVILAMWTQEEATFEGTYYQVRGAINQPKGVQQPHIPVLIAGSGERVTLKLVAQYGDACSITGDPATMKRRFAVLKQHCEAIGRDYESIHRTAIGFCSLGETDEQARANVSPDSLSLLERLGVTTLIGSPATIRAGLAELEAVGVQEVILSFPDILQPETLRFFAREFLSTQER
jgi:F420-dependent oxidoreductase-like protein